MLTSIVKYLSVLLISVIVGCLVVGEFILWQALPVSCSNSEKLKANNPTKFVTNAKDQGPFRGERWSQLVDTDLSKWYLKNKTYESRALKSRINAQNKYNVNSTPTLIINEKKFKGSLKNIEKYIQKLL